jgi:hypothetical protein
MSKRQGGDLDSQGVNGAKIQKTEAAANGLQQVGVAIYTPVAQSICSSAQFMPTPGTAVKLHKKL